MRRIVMNDVPGYMKGAIANREKALEKYYENPTVCKYCGKIIPVKDHEKVAVVRRKSFCNNSCAASYNNEGVAHNKRKIKPCAACGDDIFGTASHCDECISKRVYNKKQSLEECKTKSARRRFIIQERGYQCECCGTKE